jgi:hypothetical protein
MRASASAPSRTAASAAPGSLSIALRNNEVSSIRRAIATFSRLSIRVVVSAISRWTCRRSSTLPDSTVRSPRGAMSLATRSTRASHFTEPAGRGKVGLCGPHPEAPPEWYREANLSYGEPTQDLGDDLIGTLMAP